MGVQGGGQSKTRKGIPVNDWNSMDAQKVLGPPRLVKHNDLRLMPSSVSAQKPANATKNTFPSLVFQQQIVLMLR